MITIMATATTTSKPPLALRIAKVAGAIVLLLVAPMIIAYVVAGPTAAAATLMAVIAGVSGAMRSGWRQPSARPPRRR